jgi:hypothetical protein
MDSEGRSLKDYLLNPLGLPQGDVIGIMRMAYEEIDFLEALVREFEHHIDNEYTLMDIRNKCIDRYSLTSSQTDCLTM